jgi:hypothetical protein
VRECNTGDADARFTVIQGGKSMDVALGESAFGSAVRTLIERTIAFLPNLATSLAVVVLA